MPTRIVAISHTWGAGGEAIGRNVAAALGYRYVDEEIISLAAQKEGLDAAVVANAERRTSVLSRVVDRLFEGPILDAAAGGLLVPEALRATSGDDVRALIVEAIHETADRGNVVIVAHAASIPLAGRPDVLRVFVTASPETCVHRIARHVPGGKGEAARIVRDSTTARADYFRRFYGIERELPTHYDLVVNTDALGIAEATDIVVAAARRRD